jgi:hypothetical protein
MKDLAALMVKTGNDTFQVKIFCQACSSAGMEHIFSWLLTRTGTVKVGCAITFGRYISARKLPMSLPCWLSIRQILWHLGIGWRLLAIVVHTVMVKTVNAEFKKWCKLQNETSGSPHCLETRLVTANIPVHQRCSCYLWPWMEFRAQTWNDDARRCLLQYSPPPSITQLTSCQTTGRLIPGTSHRFLDCKTAAVPGSTVLLHLGIVGMLGHD